QEGARSDHFARYRSRRVIDRACTGPRDLLRLLRALDHPVQLADFPLCFPELLRVVDQCRYFARQFASTLTELANFHGLAPEIKKGTGWCLCQPLPKRRVKGDFKSAG